MIFSGPPLPLSPKCSASASGGSVLLQGAGPPFSRFYLLTAPHVSLPADNWSRVATNQFDAAGRFSLTHTPAAGTPQVFYTLQLP